ncbi:hypothetical protein D0Y65_007109 [Glycine soja]|uniref:Uncharacterized protein n=1 Tax=Glycine soja TaxID=3848 RepID=A0A445LBA7_GLYSO|nr:hypothetical protein JHK87_007272 [Glycine soja]RZC20586.1 hypothetical protein D0Y65_007109 [Glycine soja]
MCCIKKNNIVKIFNTFPCINYLYPNANANAYLILRYRKKVISRGVQFNYLALMYVLCSLYLCIVYIFTGKYKYNLCLKNGL